MTFSLIFIKVFIGACIFLIVSRLLSVYFSDIIEKWLTSRKSKSKDIDFLIKEQEQILRSRMGQLSAPIPKTKENQKKGPTPKMLANLSIAERSYADQVQNSAQKVKQDTMKVLQLYDNAKWGDGKLYQEILTEFKPKFKQQLELIQLHRTFQKCDSENLFIYKKNTLLTYPQIKQCLLNFLYVNKLLEQCIDGKGTILNEWVIKCGFTKDIVIKAVEVVFYSHDTKNIETHLKRVLSNHYTSAKNLRALPSAARDELVIQLIYDSDKGLIFDKTIMLAKAKEYAAIIDGLGFMEPLRGSELEKTVQAFKLLGLTESSHPREIKKKYKELVKKKHPDKVNSRIHDKKLHHLAHENFTVIQEAYELALKKTK